MARHVLTDIMGTTTHNDFVGELTRYFESHVHPYASKTIVDALKAGRLVPEYIGFMAVVTAKGYENGKLVPPFFEDVARNMRRWKQQDGSRIFSYSNGDADEQRLMFRHSNLGDLTSLVDAHFGTDLFGMKNDPKSFRKVCKAIGAKPSEVVFLSDRSSELDAASTAGMPVYMVVRPGNKELEHPTYPVVTSFDQVKI
ncbi:HAD-IA family hydrolase [Candidatus Woesearchaeota archaeon]|nr:HAD-IA family hydrolase [Candidatus Woesearchaeota archaeon]